jgi:hypothetical protein
MAPISSVVAPLMRRPQAYMTRGTSCGLGCGGRRAAGGPDRPTVASGGRFCRGEAILFPRTAPRHGRACAGRRSEGRNDWLEGAACYPSLAQLEQIAPNLVLAEQIGRAAATRRLERIRLHSGPHDLRPRRSHSVQRSFTDICGEPYRDWPDRNLACASYSDTETGFFGYARTNTYQKKLIYFLLLP